MANKYASVIVLKLPDGLHYYCGKVKYMGNWVDDWDLDLTYAIIYFDRTVAKKRCSVLKLSKAQAKSKVKDFYRLPKSEQQKRNVNNLFNFKFKN
jgi:hypothetical protein